MRGWTCDGAVIGSRSSFLWKHLRRFSSSSSSTRGRNHSSPGPPPAQQPTTARPNRRRNTNTRRKSPPRRPKPSARTTSSSSPGALLESISTIVAAGGAAPPQPTLPTGVGEEAEGGRPDGLCGQAARRIAPERFFEMPRSGEKEEEAQVLAVGGPLGQAEDLSPTVQKITDIVRSGDHGTTTVEDRLGSCDVVFTPEVVEMVLKRCFKAGHSALRFFTWARRQPGFHHTTATYNAVMYIAGEAREFDVVEKLLGWMEEDSCSMDLKSWTILIHHYGKAKRIGKALWAFEQMKKRGCDPDRMAYDAIVRALCQVGKAEIAVEFYKEMVGRDMGVDNDLYQVLMNCLATSGDVMMVRSIGEHMRKTVSDDAVYSCMLKSFCISGRIEEAKELTDEIIKKENLALDPGNMEILAKGLCKAGRASEALEIVCDTERNHPIDNKVYGHIVSAYLRKGDVQKALKILHHIKELGSLPMVSTYTEVLQHLFRSGDYQKACELYDEMLGDGVEPDIVAITAMVAGHVCSNHLPEAWYVFEDMKKKGMNPTWKAYSVFIKELCKMSRHEEAFKLLVEMVDLNLNPKHEIFRLVISSLREKGDAEKVRRVEQMTRSFNIHILDGDPVDLSSVQEESKILDCSYNLHLQSAQTPKRFNDNDLREVCKVLSSSNNWVSMIEDLIRAPFSLLQNLWRRFFAAVSDMAEPFCSFFHGWGNRLVVYIQQKHITWPSKFPAAAKILGT